MSLICNFLKVESYHNKYVLLFSPKNQSPLTFRTFRTSQSGFRANESTMELVKYQQERLKCVLFLLTEKAGLVKKILAFILPRVSSKLCPQREICGLLRGRTGTALS